MTIALMSGLAACAVAGSEQTVCKTAATVVQLTSLPEASGLAMTRGVLWLHNDSGAPDLFAVDAKGQQVGRMVLNGARVEDWEALAAGPCGKGRCLFVGDIGDNDGARKQVTIYRVAEPSQPGGSANAEALHATYPDGAHDAEALLVAPDGTMFIVTKGETGPIALYKFPRETRTGSTVRLERVGELKSRASAEERVTDGAFSTDGRWVVLRTRRALSFYSADEFMLGHFREMHRVDVSGLNEPQGEAVTFGPGNTVYVAGEGGGKKQPGTLASLACAL